LSIRVWRRGRPHKGRKSGCLPDPAHDRDCSPQRRTCHYEGTDVRPTLQAGSPRCLGLGGSAWNAAAAGPGMAHVGWEDTEVVRVRMETESHSRLCVWRQHPGYRPARVQLQHKTGCSCNVAAPSFAQGQGPNLAYPPRLGIQAVWTERGRTSCRSWGSVGPVNPSARQGRNLLWT